MKTTNDIKQQLQKCYIWVNDPNTKEPLAILYGSTFPVINEKIVIFNGESEQYYTVVNRIFGINKLSTIIVLNLYVLPVIKK